MLKNLEIKVNSIATSGKFIVYEDNDSFVFNAMEGSPTHMEIAEHYGIRVYGIKKYNERGYPIRMRGGGNIAVDGEYLLLYGESISYGAVPMDLLKRLGKPLKESYTAQLQKPIKSVIYRVNRVIGINEDVDINLLGQVEGQDE